jgi:hypothetical protein
MMMMMKLVVMVAPSWCKENVPCFNCVCIDSVGGVNKAVNKKSGIKGQKEDICLGLSSEEKSEEDEKTWPSSFLRV